MGCTLLGRNDKERLAISDRHQSVGLALLAPVRNAGPEIIDHDQCPALSHGAGGDAIMAFHARRDA